MPKEEKIEINQVARVIIGCDELVKIIKSHLVQDEDAQAPIIYDVEYKIDCGVYLFAVKDVMVGEVKGKIKEEILDSTIKSMVLDYIKTEDYVLDCWNYMKENDEKGKCFLKGVRFSFRPKEVKSLIKELQNTKGGK